MWCTRGCGLKNVVADLPIGRTSDKWQVASDEWRGVRDERGRSIAANDGVMRSRGSAVQARSLWTWSGKEDDRSREAISHTWVSRSEGTDCEWRIANGVLRDNGDRFDGGGRWLAAPVRWGERFAPTGVRGRPAEERGLVPSGLTGEKKTVARGGHGPAYRA
jgi:hypothetical protein